MSVQSCRVFGNQNSTLPVGNYCISVNTTGSLTQYVLIIAQYAAGTNTGFQLNLANNIGGSYALNYNLSAGTVSTVDGMVNLPANSFYTLNNSAGTGLPQV